MKPWKLGKLAENNNFFSRVTLAEKFSWGWEKWLNTGLELFYYKKTMFSFILIAFAVGNNIEGENAPTIIC